MKRRTALKRSTYRALRSDEPDPDGTPLIYATSDGRTMQRWKIAPRTYVERVMRDRAGELVRSRPFKAKRIDHGRARRLYESGETMAAIAATLGCHESAISRGLRSMGVNRRPPSAGRPYDANVVLARHAEGDGHTAIARDLGVSARRIKTTLIDHGVQLHKAGSVRGRGRQPDGGVSYDTAFQAMRPMVRQRSGGRCEATASPSCSGRATHVHHRKMRSQGGSNALGNLLDCCIWCHTFIHSNPARSYEAGWLVHTWDAEACG